MSSPFQQEEKHRAMEYAVQLVSVWAQRNDCDINSLQKQLLSVYETILHRIMKDIPNHYKPINLEDISATFTDDHIVCLEDGKKLKMLKRHLRSKYNMTLEEYKNKWGLPQDYPVVAKNYAKARSLIAQRARSNANTRKLP